MRSDHLITHTKNKHKEEMEADWSKVLEASQDVYYKKVQFGHQIYKSIKSKEIDQIALSEDEVSCLTLRQPCVFRRTKLPCGGHFDPPLKKAYKVLQNNGITVLIILRPNLAFI